MNLPTTTPNDRDLAWYVRECEWLDDRNRVLAAEVDQWAARCAAAIWMLPETVTGGQLREAQDKFHRERENLRRENAALREDWQLSERRWVAREKEWAEKTVEIEKENAALRELLHRSLFWLDDYDSRQFSGSAKIADDIKEVLRKEAQPWGNDPIMRRHLSEGGTPA